MRIEFHGAAGGEVTGSAYLVQTKRARVLVDCGMFQGGREAAAKNRPPETARRGTLEADPADARRSRCNHKIQTE